MSRYIDRVEFVRKLQEIDRLLGEICLGTSPAEVFTEGQPLPPVMTAEERHLRDHARTLYEMREQIRRLMQIVSTGN